MSTRISDLLAAAAGSVDPVVRTIRDDQLDLPTPCAQYRVRDLLNHLFQVVVNFRALAARQPVEWAEAPDYVRDDWRGWFATQTGPLIRAWADPAALEGVSPGMGLPQEVVGGMVLLDLTVHGWDLARATGQPFRASAEVVAALHDLAARLGPQAREAGVFAEPVPVPDGAGDLDRLLGLTGRDPAWRPAG